MKVVNGSKFWKATAKPVAIALGNFDGVHLGHQAIIKHLVRTAKKKRWMSAVYTFAPHPAKVLNPSAAPLLLQTIEQKTCCLKKLQIDAVIVEPFTLAFSKMSPEKFFKKILLKRLGAAGIWIGYDFTFGHERTGDVEKLKALCEKYKLQFHLTTAQTFKKTRVSSTQIRKLAINGHMEEAWELLGHPFCLAGKVVQGKGLGSKMGLKTANLALENELFPKPGVYITRTHTRTKKSWPSVTNVGWNPTFPGKGFSVETHIIGYDGDLVGKKIQVAFLKPLRKEMKFESPEKLLKQIHKDISEAKRFHANLRHHRTTT